MTTHTMKELQAAAAFLKKEDYDVIGLASAQWQLRYLVNELVDMGLVSKEDSDSFHNIQRMIVAVYRVYVTMKDEQEKMNEMFSLLDESVAHPTTQED